jgi:acetyltransferase-like isoleucine patch superfamily enzyme
MREHLPPDVRQFLRRLLGPHTGLEYVAGLFVAKLPSYRLHHALYRAAGLTLAPMAHIHKGLELRRPSGVTIGEDTVIGFDSILDGRSGLVLGKHVNLSSEVAIWTLQHDHRDPLFSAVGAPVHVGDYAWLSFRATILRASRSARRPSLVPGPS